MRDHRLAAVVALFVSGVVAVSAHAHTGPYETIARITKQIDENGATVDLLVQRAIEYRTVGDYVSAKRDLKQAASRDATNFMALRELAQVDLCIGEFGASLAAVNQALQETHQDLARYSLFALRAEIHGAAGRTDAALRDIESALQSEHPQVDWFLQRSRLQWSTEQFTKRVQDLRDATVRNPSIVLQHELTDALIDAGVYKESLNRVEAELETCRDCAAWQIRRARIRRGIGDNEGATTDLMNAIASLSAQLKEQRNSPLDLTTIVERATAYALLGDTARAHRGLQFAQALEADEWLTAPLARLVAQQSANGD